MRLAGKGNRGSTLTITTSEPAKVTFVIALYSVLPSWSCVTAARESVKAERRRVTSPLLGRMDSWPEPTKEPLVVAEASSKRVPVMTVLEKMKLPGGRIQRGRLAIAF